VIPNLTTKLQRKLSARCDVRPRTAAHLLSLHALSPSRAIRGIQFKRHSRNFIWSEQAIKFISQKHGRVHPIVSQMKLSNLKVIL